MDYATRLAAGMHLVAPHHVLCAEHIMEEWDPQLVREGRGGAAAVGWGRGGKGSLLWTAHIPPELATSPMNATLPPL